MTTVLVRGLEARKPDMPSTSWAGGVPAWVAAGSRLNEQIDAVLSEALAWPSWNLAHQGARAALAPMEGVSVSDPSGSAA